MGLEDTKAQRLADFNGYQVTEKLCAEGGAGKGLGLFALPSPKAR